MENSFSIESEPSELKGRKSEGSHEEVSFAEQKK